MTIYSSDKEKIEVSANDTVLRRTLYKHDRPCEYLYYRETDPVQIRKIEERSVIWRRLKRGSHGKYYVEIQLNAKNQRLGNIRIIPHSNAKRVKEKVYLYYVRRRK